MLRMSEYGNFSKYLLKRLATQSAKSQKRVVTGFSSDRMHSRSNSRLIRATAESHVYGVAAAGAADVAAAGAAGDMFQGPWGPVQTSQQRIWYDPHTVQCLQTMPLFLDLSRDRHV